MAPHLLVAQDGGLFLIDEDKPLPDPRPEPGLTGPTENSETAALPPTETHQPEPDLAHGTQAASLSIIALTATLVLLACILLSFRLYSVIKSSRARRRKSRNARESANLSARRWHGTRPRTMRQGILDATGYGGLGSSRPPSYHSVAGFEEVPLHGMSAPQYSIRSPEPGARHVGQNARKYFTGVQRWMSGGPR